MTLPQYLLKRADSKWSMACGFRLRPAPTDHWTLMRWLGLVVLQTAIFALAGGFLSFLLYRVALQRAPAAWPIWWLGMFGFCRALVVHGLTVLCWNQRVERLRLNADATPGRLRIPPVRWLLATSYFVLLSLVTPAAMWITTENVRGRIAWAQFRRELEARGENLDPAQLTPPSIPDDQIFAMAPLLRPLFDLEETPQGPRARDTNGRARLGAITATLNVPSGTNRYPGAGSLERGTLADFEALQSFFRGNTNYPQAEPTAPPAAAVRQALSKFDRDLDELNAAAEQRPQAGFAFQPGVNFNLDAVFPQLSTLKGLTVALQLRAATHLALNQPKEAFADLKTNFRIAEIIRESPVFIAYLVRIALIAIDLQGIADGLARHAWSDLQLAELDRHLAAIDLLAEFKHSIRGERSIVVDSFLQGRAPFFPVDAEVQGSSPPGFSILSVGWRHQNGVEIALVHQRILDSVDERARRVIPDKSGTNAVITPYNILAGMLAPALSKGAQQAARIQTWVDQARLACALERYRLANGSLPDSLTALVPRFIDKIPTDILDGAPLRYARDTEGGYILYSVGWNRTDDGGKTVWTGESNPRVEREQGDWVWRLPKAP